MTIFRDKSADVTLKNANEGIMSDSKYAKSDPRNPDPKGDFAYRASLEAEIDALKAENELLRADAERYRWLRNPCVDIRPVIKYSRGDYGWGLLTHLALDEAIDAAMKDFSTTTKEEGEKA